jgi:hypothetical protein
MIEQALKCGMNYSIHSDQILVKSVALVKIGLVRYEFRSADFYLDQFILNNKSILDVGLMLLFIS